MKPQYDVLVVMDHYLPGRLAGGPVTTVLNMIHRLPSLRFLVVTQNHDLDGTPYAGFPLGLPIPGEGGDVVYLSREEFQPATFRALMSEFQIPTLYLNSFFSAATVRTLISHRIRAFPGRVVLAPRGEFSPGALTLKRRKKKMYLQAFQALGLGRHVTFQASSGMEARELTAVLGPLDVKVAADVPAVVPRESEEGDPCQLPAGPPGLVFISRIVRKKNLKYALDRVLDLEDAASFDVYGPLEDALYWQECQEVIHRRGGQGAIRYCGTLDHAQVAATFRKYDAFVFPTLGENYGHVIYEALAAGCTVITSDQTPWQDLEREGVGFVAALDQPQDFTRALAQVLARTEAERKEARRRCVAYARHLAESEEVLKANLALFSHA